MPWVLVTGAAKGFGRAICIELARQGHDIVIHYRNSQSEALETAALCQELGVMADICYGDFSTPHSLKTFMNSYAEKFSVTKGLVNNVGNYLLKPVLGTTGEEWLSLMQTNLYTPFFLIQSLKDSLKRFKGCIVNIGTSGVTHLRPRPAHGAYSISKTALWHLTVSFAKELAPDFVRVNMVSPGYLETAIDLKDSQGLPMKRPASLEEAARLVAFFFAEENSYITGQNLEITGGVGL